MKSYHGEMADRLGHWLRSTGFTGDLASIAAALSDIGDSFFRIRDELVPGMLALEPESSDQSLESTVELRIEMEHVRSHAEAAVAALLALGAHLDSSTPATGPPQPRGSDGETSETRGQ